MRSKSYIARWKNFLNLLTQMFDTSNIVALAGNDSGLKISITPMWKGVYNSTTKQIN